MHHEICFGLYPKVFPCTIVLVNPNGYDHGLTLPKRFSLYYSFSYSPFDCPCLQLPISFGQGFI